MEQLLGSLHRTGCFKHIFFVESSFTPDGGHSLACLD